MTKFNPPKHRRLVRESHRRDGGADAKELR